MKTELYDQGELVGWVMLYLTTLYQLHVLRSWTYGLNFLLNVSYVFVNIYLLRISVLQGIFEHKSEKV